MAAASKPSATTNYTLKTSKEAPGKKEQVSGRLDEPLSISSSRSHPLTLLRGNAIVSTRESPTLAFLNNFSTANSTILSSVAAGLVSLDNKTIGAAITRFSEAVKAVMNGLDALGQVHPFVGDPELLELSTVVDMET